MKTRMTPTGMCDVFNLIHDENTEDLEKMLSRCQLNPKPVNKMIGTQVEYVIELRKLSGNKNNKRPWRK